jgi:hypothetical protein
MPISKHVTGHHEAHGSNQLLNVPDHFLPLLLMRTSVVMGIASDIAGF